MPEPTPYFDTTITTAKHKDDTCTDINADRVLELLAAGERLADRKWWQVLGEPEPSQPAETPAPVAGDDTLVLDEPVPAGEDSDG